MPEKERERVSESEKERNGERTRGTEREREEGGILFLSSSVSRRMSKAPGTVDAGESTGEQAH